MNSMPLSMSFDILSIQRIVADFALRDRCDWDGLTRLFSQGAQIRISWYSGDIEGFIAASKGAAERGAPPSKHTFGYPRIDVANGRAIAETDVQVVIRLGGEALFDVTSWMRFFDLFTFQEDHWKIIRRTAIYERDRLDPLDGASSNIVSQQELLVYPTAYRHLAFVLSQVGLGLAKDTVVSGSREEDVVRADGQLWLSEGTLPLN